MLNIALVNPEIPQNTGNIARTAAATRSRLHLIHPLGFSLDEKHLKRAGLDYWKDVEVVEHQDLDTFLAQLPDDNTWFFSARGGLSSFEVKYTTGPDAGCWLIFGRESCGLPEDLVRRNRERCLHIPMVGGTRSLNLSNSVAIAVYEYYRQLGFPPPFNHDSRL